MNLIEESPLINVPVGILVASICDLLEENLAPNLTYHCLGHTVAVMESATLIAQQEGFSTDEQALLQLAAAFHDSGFCIMRQANEPVGAYLLTSALYHTQSKKTPEPSLNKIDGAAELAKLPMNDYRNKCTAMKNKLIEKIGRQQASQIEVSAAARDVCMNTTLENLTQRLEEMIHSTALLKDENGQIFRKASEPLAGALLDADLASFGQNTFAREFKRLIEERGLVSRVQRLEFAQQSKAMLSHHKWFTVTGKKVFQAQQKINLQWVEAYIQQLDIPQ